MRRKPDLGKEVAAELEPLQPLGENRHRRVRLLIHGSFARQSFTDDSKIVHPGHYASNAAYNSFVCCCMTNCRAWVICCWYWGM